MYLTPDAILEATRILKRSVHPFMGITFLACKSFQLSVSSVDDVSLDALTRAHLDAHHKIDHRSDMYFQPFKSKQFWVDKKYPSAGLQTINTQTFKKVFLHTRSSKSWGFHPDYVSSIVDILTDVSMTPPMPADALAVWLLKDEDIGDVVDFEALTELFLDRYFITPEERKVFFSRMEMPISLSMASWFSSQPLEMVKLIRMLPSARDRENEGGRSIQSIQIKDVGPSPSMAMAFGERLTVVTGDNGLGKSFLMDTAWWAATGVWAGREALPWSSNPRARPSIKFSLRGADGREIKGGADFNASNQTWTTIHTGRGIEALSVFSRADGSFAIYDPYRRGGRHALQVNNLTASEVWDGRTGVIEGLIRDWVKWQRSPDQKSFDRFKAVLLRLSPEDLGDLRPGEPVRISDDTREIPTITHRYATVPITHASSGVRRVLTMAYLLIWSWEEHLFWANQSKQPPLRRMLTIVDELEAHLHPKWQRIVLPALMGVGDLLSAELAMQTITATHSPMILASLEGTFDPKTDLLYHLVTDRASVKLEETTFTKYGDVSGWLTSPIFGLRHARSIEGERAIEDAKALQLADHVDPALVREVSDRLKRYLAADDKFWPRWLFYAESHGVRL